MEAEAVEGDPVEADDVRSNADLFGRFGDSDSDSDSDYSTLYSRRKSMFWYESPNWRDIPDYRVLPYPWGEEEEEGKDYVVTDTTCSDLSDEHRRRGRWGELPEMVRRKSAADLSACLETVADEQQQSLCTSAEVLKVRMEMHECYEKGISYRRLFKSEANRDELFFHNADDELYVIYVIRCQREPRVTSYAHVFPDLDGTDPQISCEWAKPTTLEGDKQCLQFFPQLMEAAKFGETKDHVFAKAIVLTRKSFQKMLRFQIDFAVQDCMELMKTEEEIHRRYDLYYFAVTEIVLNKMEFKSVLKSIRNGDSGLPYDLTEFAPSQADRRDGHIADIVDHLVNYFNSQRQCGMYQEWVCEEVDWEVARIVCETVDALVPSPCDLYVRFLRKKMTIARELGLLTSEEDMDPECVGTTDMQVISEEHQEARV
ncbi:unnamed protein product [Urochloa decumbens]|uniref:Uncharacterized protein n=1 Tax=Urochloa decumbens TaxID=240449 RepID=A0ABC8VB96_9POAL